MPRDMSAREGRTAPATLTKKLEKMTKQYLPEEGEEEEEEGKGRVRQRMGEKRRREGVCVRTAQWGRRRGRAAP